VREPGPELDRAGRDVLVLSDELGLRVGGEPRLEVRTLPIEPVGGVLGLARR
jgi:hypothetical protein